MSIKLQTVEACFLITVEVSVVAYFKFNNTAPGRTSPLPYVPAYT